MKNEIQLFCRHLPAHRKTGFVMPCRFQRTSLHVFLNTKEPITLCGYHTGGSKADNLKPFPCRLRKYIYKSAASRECSVCCTFMVLKHLPEVRCFLIQVLNFRFAQLSLYIAPAIHNPDNTHCIYGFPWQIKYNVIVYRQES